MSQHSLWPWLGLLTAAGLLSQATVHLVRPATTYKLIGLGADGLTVGLVSGAYALLPLIFALWIGCRAQRAPDLRALLSGGSVVVVVGSGVLAWGQSISATVLGSAVLGLGQLVFMVAAQAAVARFSAPHQMDMSFGWFTAGLSGGQLIGPLIGGVLVGESVVGAESGLSGADQALWVGGLLSLLSIVFIQFIRVGSRGFGASHGGGRSVGPLKEKGASDTDEPTVRRILARRGMKSHLFASVAMLAILDILSAFMPLFGEETGISPLWVGILLSARAAASIVSRLFLPLLRRRWSREALVLVGLWVSAVALGLVPLSGSSVGLVLALFVWAGFFLGMGQPLTMSLVAQGVPESWQSSALALRLMGNRVGQVVIPVSAGGLAALFGSAGAMWGGVGLLIASGVEKLVVYRRRS